MGLSISIFSKSFWLLLLAGYQFAEVAVCSNPENLLYSRLAFFNITWLPPLGLWLVYQLSAPRNKWLKILPASYFVSGLAFSFWILLDSRLALLVFWAAAALAFSGDSILRRHLANIQTGMLGFIFPSMAVRILMLDLQGSCPLSCVILP